MKEILTKLECGWNLRILFLIFIFIIVTVCVSKCHVHVARCVLACILWCVSKSGNSFSFLLLWNPGIKLRPPGLRGRHSYPQAISQTLEGPVIREPLSCDPTHWKSLSVGICYLKDDFEEMHAAGIVTFVGWVVHTATMSTGSGWADLWCVADFEWYPLCFLRLLSELL